MTRTNIQMSSSGIPSLGTFAIFVGRLFNRWIATMIARSEREATRAALRYLGDRELKDIGVYRAQVDDAFVATARERLRLQARRQFSE